MGIGEFDACRAGHLSHERDGSSGDDMNSVNSASSGGTSASVSAPGFGSRIALIPELEAVAPADNPTALLQLRPVLRGEPSERFRVEIDDLLAAVDHQAPGLAFRRARR